VVVRGDAVTYSAGVEFVDPTAEVLDSIRRVIESAGSAAD
jgi:hypothetical protein